MATNADLWNPDVIREFQLKFSIDLKRGSGFMPTITSSGEAAWSNIAQLFNDPENIPFENLGTFEGEGFWLSPSSYQNNLRTSLTEGSDYWCGWVSNNLSDVDGLLINTYLDMNNSSTTETYYIQLQFNPNFLSVAKDFNVLFYNASGQIVETINITNNTLYKISIVTTQPFKRIHIDWLSTTLPKTRIRLVDIDLIDTLEYDDEQIVSFSSDEQFSLPESIGTIGEAFITLNATTINLNFLTEYLKRRYIPCTIKMYCYLYFPNGKIESYPMFDPIKVYSYLITSIKKEHNTNNTTLNMSHPTILLKDTIFYEYPHVDEFPKVRDYTYDDLMNDIKTKSNFPDFFGLDYGMNTLFLGGQIRSFFFTGDVLENNCLAIIDQLGLTDGPIIMHSEGMRSFPRKGLITRRESLLDPIQQNNPNWTLSNVAISMDLPDTLNAYSFKFGNSNAGYIQANNLTSIGVTGAYIKIYCYFTNLADISKLTINTGNSTLNVTPFISTTNKWYKCSFKINTKVTQFTINKASGTTGLIYIDTMCLYVPNNGDEQFFNLDTTTLEWLDRRISLPFKDYWYPFAIMTYPPNYYEMADAYTFDNDGLLKEPQINVLQPIKNIIITEKCYQWYNTLPVPPNYNPYMYPPVDPDTLDYRPTPEITKVQGNHSGALDIEVELPMIGELTHSIESANGQAQVLSIKRYQKKVIYRISANGGWTLTIKGWAPQTLDKVINIAGKYYSLSFQDGQTINLNNYFSSDPNLFGHRYLYYCQSYIFSLKARANPELKLMDIVRININEQVFYAYITSMHYTYNGSLDATYTAIEI